MILLWLTLDGFRLHRRTEVTFGPGLTAIVGANGAGKSTLIEAITFALFGEQRGNRETLRADDGGPYRVRLGFQVGEAEFVVDRRPDRASLEQGQLKIAEGLSDTTRACIRLLGLSYEQFRNSFLAEQKGLSFLKFRSASVRQEEVARMLGLDRLRAAENRAIEARKAASLEARTLEGTVGDEAAIRAAAREADEVVKAAQAQVLEARDALERSTSGLKEVDDLGRAAEAYLGLVARSAASTEALRQAQAVLKVAKETVDTVRIEATELVSLAPDATRHEELRTLLPVVESAAQALAEAEALDPNGTGFVADLKAAFEAAQREWQKRRDALLASRAAAQQAVRAAEQAIRETKQGEAGGKCPVCGQLLGEEAHDWRRELQGRLEAAETQLKTATDAANEQPPPDLATLPNQIRAAERRAEAVQKLQAHPAGLADLRAQIVDLEPNTLKARKLAGADRRLRDAEAMLEKAALDEKRATEVARATAEALAKTGIADENAARRALAEAASVKASAIGSEAALNTAMITARSGEAALRNAEARLKEAQTRRQALQAARHTELLSGAVATEMRALRATLNGALRPDLEARAGELLEKMTAGRYRRLRLGSDFEPTLVDEESDRPVLSGGEEDVLALALRLALAELVQDRKGHSLTLLMMDEAFGALDTERRQSLLDVLTGLRDRYEQVIVVTHIEDVAQVADQVLRVERDATGAARVNEA
jgi:exonuclease SbcC